MTVPVPTPFPAPRRLILFAAAAMFLLSLCLFASLGLPQGFDIADAILIVLGRLIFAGAAPAAYLLAGVGLGRLFCPLLRRGTDPLALQAAAGLASLLWLSHLLGWLGLLKFPAVAIAPIAVGGVLALHQLITTLKGRGTELRLSPFSILSAIGIALLLVAACNPPGALWGSEFGGYDVLEYHLQLPQEWLAQGRIAPLAHNVYSYLPSYLEAAYTHLGAFTLAPEHVPDGPSGLAAGEGDRLISCQLLHAGFAILAAWFTARLIRHFMIESAPRHFPPEVAKLNRIPTLDDCIPYPSPAIAVAPALAFALLLLTPWTIVTGSMAYNEMAMIALFAAALLAASDSRLSTASRSTLTGLLIGIACSVKPTALLFCGIPAAMFLLFNPQSQIRNPKSLLALTLPGTAAGLLALAPWLIRNYAAAHNPVFPFAASLFGTDGWTTDQAARYTRAHQFHGTILDRLRLLVLPDPHPTQTTVSAQRGLMHPQFGLLFPFTLIAAIPLLRIPRRMLAAAKQRAKDLAHHGQQTATEDYARWRSEHDEVFGRIFITFYGGSCVTAVLIQLLLWLFTTHLQARFLIPLEVPAVALIALAAAVFLNGLSSRNPQSSFRNLLLIPLALLPLTQLGYAASIFAHERTGQPNLTLIQGPALRTGELLRTLPPADQQQAINGPDYELFINLALPPTTKVCLLGGATPLYLTRPILYNTTYDTWPISGDPAAWDQQLRAKGVDAVLVDLGEVGRLGRSHWLPPDISLDAVKNWVINHTTVVHAWESQGVYLVRPAKPTPDPAAH